MLVPENLLQYGQLLLLFSLPDSLIPAGIDTDGILECLGHVLCASQEVQAQLILQKKEEVHVNVELLKFVVVAVFEALEQLAKELHGFGMLVPKDTDHTFAALFLFLILLLVQSFLGFWIINSFDARILFDLITSLTQHHRLHFFDSQSF